jgi:hypothetical protein
MRQVLCSGAFNLRQHVEGRKHKGKIEELEHIRKCEGEKANQHLQGARHREKLQELEYGKDGGEVLNRPKWCELCKLFGVQVNMILSNILKAKSMPLG